MSTQQDLNSFNNFALQQLNSGCTIDELFDQWRSENPSNELYEENVAAIRASIEDHKNGERGTPAGAHSAELRRDFGITGK
jgi:hypothetical protein